MKQILTIFTGFNKGHCAVFLMMLSLIFYGAFTGAASAAGAIAQRQPNSVTGTVYDEHGSPMSGVSIKVKDTNISTVTDLAGQFSVTVPTADGVLIVSYIGFKTAEVALGGQRTLVINLTEDISKLSEVVVVGYSVQSRETITNAVSKLDEKVLRDVPFSNAASALQGTLAGVRVQSLTGQPGEAPRVIVRGGTSISNPNGANPLYIVDGVIRPQLYNINPADIESIQVLKDAASTAMYGARGSNGVVIVTTKSGKAGRFQVDYRYSHMLSQVGKVYELANARDYLELMRLGEVAAPKFPNPNRIGIPIGYGTGNDLTNNTAFSTQYLTDANRHKLDEGWQSMPDPLDPSKTIIFTDTDFQSLVYQTGRSHDNYVTMSGGTDRARLNIGVGYLTNDGTVITTKYNRLSMNLNGDLKARDNLSFFGRLSFSNSTQNNPNLSYAETFYRSGGLAPTAKFRFEDGTLAPGTNRSIGNPVYQLNTRVFDESTDYLTLSVGSKWDILPGLSFNPQLSTFRINGNSYSFQKAYWNGPLSYDVNRNANGTLYKYVQNQIDGILSYTKSIADHNFDAKAVFSYYGRTESRMNANGRGASTDIVPTLNASAVPVSVSSTITDQVLLGYFTGVNYDFMKKYLFTLNLKYDGASNLGDDHKWGFFPGASIGWNIDREEFWKALPEGLLKMKLRASYGVNGNISGLGDFTAQGVYSVGPIYGGAGAIQNTVIPNANLQWERSETVNGGVEIGILDSRFNVIFDIFRRVTDNLLTPLTLPSSTGFATVLTNYGSLENRGIELEVSANVLPATSPFRWNLSMNASKVNNKILSLPDNGIENNRVGGYYVWDAAISDYAWKGGLQEGGRPGDMYDRKQLGIYATDAEAATAPTDTYIAHDDKTKFGGDTNWQDTDGNGIIDSRDLVYMGNIYPKWTGGISNTFGYKNFELYVRADFTTGHSIFNWAMEFMEGNLYGDGNITQRKVDRAWREQGDVTDMPRMYWGGERTQRNTFNGTANSGSSFYWEKGDFLAIRELTLSYSLPAALLNRIKLNGIRFNVTANNLYYFTNYAGMNPEDGGVDDGRFPMPRNFIFGVNLSL